jgi:hypothetical protein
MPFMMAAWSFIPLLVSQRTHLGSPCNGPAWKSIQWPTP